MTQPIALVTGGNTGIGYEVVRALAKRGMTVYLGSRNSDRGSQAAAELKAEGDIRPLLLDVTDASHRQAALASIEAAHGRLDLLINNAGASLSGNALEVTPETLNESFEINAFGPLLLTQSAILLLRKSAHPRIVNVSSAAGSFGWLSNLDPRFDTLQMPYAYCAAKSAMNVGTLLLASALKPDGIKINSVSPGYVKSQVSRFMGTRTPAEGAQSVLRFAIMDDDGPTGGFFDEHGNPLSW
jgi:NAD(P)-dependent dehydrogenase (short-subunit alcohol dehydrogenase family)